MTDKSHLQGKCETCRFIWLAKAKPANIRWECRRRAPATLENVDRAWWPRVEMTDGCGEWEGDGN